MQYENERRNRPVWLFILAAILLVLLIVLLGRGCRDEYGTTPPPMMSDSLDVDTDTTMSPGGQDGYPDTTNGGLRDTALRGPTDTIEDPSVPAGPPAMPASPGTPAVMPGTGSGGTGGM